MNNTPKDFYDRFKELSPAEERQQENQEKNWFEKQDDYYINLFLERKANLEKGFDFYGEPFNSDDSGWMVSLKRTLFFPGDEGPFVEIDCFVHYSDFLDFIKEYGMLMTVYDFQEGKEFD